MVVAAEHQQPDAAHTFAILNRLAANYSTARRNQEALVRFLEQCMQNYAGSAEADGHDGSPAADEGDEADSRQIQLLELAACVRHMFRLCMPYGEVAKVRRHMGMSGMGPGL